jgi:hypothetical protein
MIAIMRAKISERDLGFIASIFCRTFKLSDELRWRGVCCSEHNP